MLAPDRSSREPDYASLLQELITKHGLKKRVTWIKVFKDDLAPYIYRHPLTRITLLPVRESPQDLIPMEARVAPTSSVLVVSNRGSNVYQVNHGADGFIADIGPPGEESMEDLARMLQTALTMGIVSRKKNSRESARK